MEVRGATGGASASLATVSVGDHLEAGDEWGIIGSRGGRGGCICGRGCGPHEEYKDPPRLHHKVLIGGYYCYLRHRDDNKGDEGNDKKDTTDATIVDPSVHPMNLYNLTPHTIHTPQSNLLMLLATGGGGGAPMCQLLSNKIPKS